MKNIIKALFIVQFVAWFVILGTIALAIAICLLVVYVAISVVMGICEYINWSSENYFPYIAKYGRRNYFIYYCMDNTN